MHIEKRITKSGEVRWRVQIRRQGALPITKTFRSKMRAREWGIQVEAGITGESRPLSKHTLLDAMREYAAKVSPGKRGGRWERIRLKALEDERITKRPIAQLGSDELGVWRDKRLAEVSPATVRREMNLLAAVFEHARTEWKWLKVNPMRDVKKPQEPPARRRGVKPGEFEKLAERLTGPAGKEVLAGFELGIETGMRAGEMWSLDREQIDLDTGVAHLEQTKNGDARDVALSPRAIDIMRALLDDGRPALFTITNASRDALFRKARDAAGLSGLHFHDSRAEAVTRLSKVFHRVQDLADQIGHRDLSSLMFYYKPSASDRARQLAGGETQTTRQPRKRPTAGEHQARPPRGRGSRGA